jgi:nucleoside-diphosphate-sugar epimerase
MPVTPAASRNLLVTGATGFLGSAVAAELLENHPGVTPLFLVRAADAAQGLARLRDALAKLGVPQARQNALTPDHVLLGDLKGFARNADDPRVAALHGIINCAAFASFAWKPDIWEINVEHTSVFARAAAALPQLTRFVHVGTAMISGSAADCVVQEDEVLDRRRQLVPYTRSKAEIEYRLPQWLDGDRLVIARPSIVVGHTRAGCTPSPSIFWFFRLIQAAGRVPFSPDIRVDIVPVDYCARALVHLALMSAPRAARYHISAGDQRACSFEAINHAYSAIKNVPATPLKAIDPDDLDQVKDTLAQSFGREGIERIMGAIRIYLEFASLDVRFENRRLLAEGMPPPPAFTDYLAECIRTGENDTITEQMKFDFR